ncbi:TerD family protein [Streptomyces chumphonensis]|uniref:TerD family protein n=1 Tax=Streptomyces chumphonensis TaxID=1214925 RepID=UPI003D70CFC5
MSNPNKGLGKVEVTLKWDPSAADAPDHDLDIIAAVYGTDDLHGTPAYLAHFDSRSPDGTITLGRDSRNGLGFGVDESMTLELDRLSSRYGRVVVGVAIQQGGGRVTFADIARPRCTVSEGYTELQTHDFTDVPDATAATLVEFVRDSDGPWTRREAVRGFDTDPRSFTRLMGAQPT